MLTWEISADWQPDPASSSEVDVRFSAVDGGRTLVELEHRGLETYAARAEEMRAVFGSDQGWGGLLSHFARVAEAA